MKASPVQILDVQDDVSLAFTLIPWNVFSLGGEEASKADPALSPVYSSAG